MHVTMKETVCKVLQWEILMLMRRVCVADEPRAGVEHDLYVQLADSTGSLITTESAGFAADSMQVCLILLVSNSKVLA